MQELGKDIKGAPYLRVANFDARLAIVGEKELARRQNRTRRTLGTAQHLHAVGFASPFA